MTTEAPPPVEDEVTTRPFADILLSLNRGKSHGEMSRKMQELVAAVTSTGKKGSLTVTISVAPTKASGVLEVTDAVTVKAPSASRAASIFYADDAHNLVRDNPNQDTLPGLRDVSSSDSRKAQ